MINRSQDTIKATPPMGVMAPSIFIPDVLNMYKLPEKMIIPTVMIQPDHVSKADAGTFPEMMPIAMMPSEWNIW